MGLWDLVDEKKEKPQEKEEIKEAEVVKEETKETKETKKTLEKKSSTKKKVGFSYPFSLYTEGRLVDITNYGFEDGKTYTQKEITDIMLRHRHYEFSGTMEYAYIEEDNVVVVTAKQHKKG